MSGAAWVMLSVFVVVIVWKLFMGQPSQDELTAMRQAVADGGILLDVRSLGEFKSGHLEGAHHIPVGELQTRLQELGSTDRPVVVYCASGARSRSASQLLRDNGFSRVHDLGSWRSWE